MTAGDPDPDHRISATRSAVSRGRGEGEQSVADQQQLIFLTDPKRFMDLVTEDDDEKRAAGTDNADDLVLCEIIRYGCFNRQEMIGPLAQFYREFVMRMPEEKRFALSRYISDMVETSGFVSINAFLPFIAEDDSRMVVSSNVIDYVSLGNLDNDDPMSRVKDILGMIDRGMLKNEGAAFGGLLHIGDPRVCNLLRPVRDGLDDDALNEAVKCQTAVMHAATIEFYLDWLEGLEGDIADGKFGIVASGLALVKKKSQLDTVSVGQRPFPTRGTTPEQWNSMRKLIPVTDYVKGVALRMYALERAEPPPRIMPDVLTTWGLTPKTDPAEMASRDDRSKTPESGLARPEPIAVGHIVDVRDEWWDGEGSVFLAWGILNPNGPTLYVLGSREVEGKQRVFFRWLHMLGGCTTWAAAPVDKLTYEGICDDAQKIVAHLAAKQEPGLFDVVPSFIIPNAGNEGLTQVAHVLLAGGKAAHANWGRHMAYVRQFGADFFGIAGAQVREYYDAEMTAAKVAGREPSEGVKFTEIRYGHLPQFRDAQIPKWADAAATQETFDEWWGIISDAKYQVSALATLKVMWEGAVSIMSEDARPRLVQWDSALRFLTNYGLMIPD
jgi:hypothetical protein